MDECWDLLAGIGHGANHMSDGTARNRRNFGAGVLTEGMRVCLLFFLSFSLIMPSFPHFAFIFCSIILS